MSMYDDVKNIYYYKGEWEEGRKSGDQKRMDDAAAKAKQFYQNLYDKGYGSVADELKAKDYASSKFVHDYYAKTGRTEVRPYLHSLGKRWGLSEGDVNKLISYDNVTGEITFGGQNIGKPDSVVDGVAYISDTGILDKAFDGYVDRAGLSRPISTAVNQENEKLFERYAQEYEDLKKTNPFETETAKSILAKYDLAGLQGRNNQLASGAGSNGGNIDSFAAANAMRQQAALVNQGQTAVLEAHQQKLDHARALLSDMGVNIDRVFNQDETAKNNEVVRLSTQASVTGYVPKQWQHANNPFFNADGTLNEAYMSDEFDATGGFTTIINNAQAALANTTDPEERERLNATISYANEAKTYKTNNNPAKYGKYAHEVMATTPPKTAEYDTTLKQIDSAEKVALSGNQTQLDIANLDASTQKSIADKNANTQLAITQKEIDAGKYAPVVDGDGDSDYVDVIYADAIQYDETRAASIDGLDEYGEKALRGLFDTCNANKGVMTHEEVVDYLVRNSDANDTDKSQLEKVLRYLGLDLSLLDNVVDVDDSAGGWKKGVRYK